MIEKIRKKLIPTTGASIVGSFLVNYSYVSEYLSQYYENYEMIKNKELVILEISFGLTLIMAFILMIVPFCLYKFKPELMKGNKGKKICTWNCAIVFVICIFEYPTGTIMAALFEPLEIAMFVDREPNKKNKKIAKKKKVKSKTQTNDDEYDDEDETEDKPEKETFKCSNCGAAVKENATKCPKCGESFEEEDKDVVEYAYCENCGTKNIKNDKFCCECGKKMTHEEAKIDNDKKTKDIKKQIKKILSQEEISEKDEKKIKKLRSELKKIQPVKTIETKNKSKSNKYLYALAGVTIVSLALNCILYCSYSSEVSKLKETVEKDESIIERKKNTIERKDDTIYDLQSSLNKLYGDHDFEYTYNKLSFVDDEIVLWIEGKGNKYYTYDCAMKLVGNDEYVFKAMNINLAKYLGYKKGTC